VRLALRPSLSRRLLVGLVLVSAAYWAVIAVLTVRDSAQQVYELFDAHLAQTALALLRVTDPDDNDPVAIPSSPGDVPGLGRLFTPWPHLPDRLVQSGALTTPVVAGSMHALHEDYERHLRYQVWSGAGALLLRSANAPESAMTAQDGYSETGDSEGRLWRHYGVWDRHHDFRILVSEAHEQRYRLVRSLSLQSAGPLALGLPVLVLLLWVSISRGLDPLGVLTRQIESRQPDNPAPLDTAGAPREVQPLLQALNRLLQRVSHTLDGERQFTAHAAHELRTPLAAIQAHLHGVRHAEDEPGRRRAMEQLQRGVERGIRLVGQLLTLARLDPEQDLPDVELVDLGAMAETVCAQLAPLALQRGQTLELQVDSDAPRAAGSTDMLSMLLSNLVDNAIRYTETGARIDVTVRRQDGGVLIAVSDDGPGIPAAQRERVFDRFVRLPGNDQPGTGLGLAICRRIAELHGARLSLADGPQGRGLSVGVLLTRGAR
jgi:two-component system sensor histidine kinase QseC